MKSLLEILGWHPMVAETFGLELGT
jgi:hypothetical protein